MAASHRDDSTVPSAVIASSNIHGALEAALAGRSVAAAEIDRGARALDAGAAEAHSRWPELDVGPERIAAYVVDRLPPGVPPGEAIEGMRVAELALAAGCAAGDRGALDAFEREHHALLLGISGRFAANQAEADDLLQRLRQHLFAGPNAAIGSYRGRGSLAGWLRVAATRQWLNWAQRRSDRDEITVTRDELLELVDGAAVTESPLTGVRYRQLVSGALAGALAALDAEERRLVRERYVAGVQVDELAARHGVHRVTMSKRLAKILRTLFRDTREELSRVLDVSDTEADQLVALVRSQLELTLSRVLPDWE
jgi:RNA polymerase sigma-70 factor (ECF subfamily)